MIEGIQTSRFFYPVQPVRAIQERYVSDQEVEEKKSERASQQEDTVEISPEAWAQYAAVSASRQTIDAAKEDEGDKNSSKPKPDSQSTSTADQGHALKQAHKSGKSSDYKEEGNSKEGKKKELTEDDKRVIAKLKKRDAEVRAHEQAHLAAAGGLAAGGASYEFEDGPDGNRYAVGGEVPISSGGGDTPEERLQNAEHVYRAALAPANPSSQDRSIASQASGDATQARAEISKEQSAKTSGEDSTSSTDPSADTKPTSDTSPTADAKPKSGDESKSESANSIPKSDWQKAIDAYKAFNEDKSDLDSKSTISAHKSEWQRAIDAYKSFSKDNSPQDSFTPFTPSTPTTPSTSRRINVSA